jgi:L-fuconolactonase
LPAEYKEMTKPHGVVGTVVVEASPRPDDNQWILDLAAKDPFLLGLVGNLAPGSKEFADHFPKLIAQPKFLGIRVNAGPLGMGLDKPEFLADLKKLCEAGRQLDVNGRPDLLPLVDKLAAKLPELRIVINHLANVRIDGPALDATWLQDLKSAAKHPHVFLKVSALVEGAAQGNRTAPTDPAYYKPILDAAFEVFGDRRVIYGSNWPVSARFGSYAVVQQIVQAYAQEKGSETADRFFHHNAKAAYQWPA